MSLALDGAVVQGSFDLRIRLHVAAGEVLVVLGPNGAGKTTLLRALAGLTALSSGSLQLDDRLLDDGAAVFVPPHRRPVGLVFQSYRLFPHLDVRDNVAFAARSSGLSRRAARERTQTWLERLDLLGLARRRPRELSGGQAQRVALARALAADPALLLLDEPLAALDAHTRLRVRGELGAHLDAVTSPVLLVTHDPLEAMVLGHRLVVLEGGRVVQDAPPTQVARSPATPYVARLMGLNLYAGRLDPVAGTVTLDGGGQLAVTPADEDDPPVAGAVLVALRPSAATLHTERPVHGSPRNVWPGTVASMDLLGDRVRVDVRGIPDVLVDVTPAAVAELALAPGAQVWVAAKATETLAYPGQRRP